MSFIQECIDEDKLSVALDHLRGDGCKYVGINGLDGAPDDVYMYFNILSIKIPKSSAKELNILKSKPVRTYHRLLLCREVLVGTLFYMIFETGVESIRMLKYTNQNYVGAHFALFEPLKKGHLHGIDILSCDTSFLPIDCNVVNMKIGKVVPSIEMNSSVQGFFVQALSLRLSRVIALDACDSKQCDSQHLRTGPCPGVLGGRAVHRLALSASISVDELKHEENVDTSFGIISENLLNVFVGRESVKRKKLDVYGLRRSVQTTLEYYREENVPWLIGGWYKRRYSSDGSPVSSRQLHVTFVQPRKILPNAPVYEEGDDIRAPPNASIGRAAAARAAPDFVADDEPAEDDSEE